MGVAAAAAAVVLAVVTWAVDRTRRAYVDSPTTPAAAVFAGRNEVKGRAWVRGPLRSPLTGIACAWWEYELEEERRHTRTVGSGKTMSTQTYERWHRVDTRFGALPWVEVVDETGSIPVRLEGASVEPRQSHQDIFHKDLGGFFERMFTNQTGRYRQTERVIAVGDVLFVVGDAELHQASGVPMLSRGVLVSTRSEESRTSTLSAAVIGLVVVTFVAFGLASTGLLSPHAREPGAAAPGLVLATVLLVLGWLVTQHNRLHQVAQGARRAWSLIDVQLARRHDLLPNLARVVAATAQHERELLASLAAERTRTSARTASEASREAADQSERLRQVFAVAEAYPELRADEAYGRMQWELADTETRIAASRTFYNDCVTLLQNRAQAFPGSLVARGLDLPSPELIAADGFEHTVPPIERSFDAAAT